LKGRSCVGLAQVAKAGGKQNPFWVWKESKCSRVLCGFLSKTPLPRPVSKRAHHAHHFKPSPTFFPLATSYAFPATKRKSNFISEEKV
jgi:hypothetical protein